jgi:hypothetical protein
MFIIINIIGCTFFIFLSIICYLFDKGEEKIFFIFHKLLISAGITWFFMSAIIKDRFSTVNTITSLLKSLSLILWQEWLIIILVFFFFTGLVFFIIMLLYMFDSI